MYHYYANKDELFLACTSEVFQALNHYLQNKIDSLANQPVFEAIKHYFFLRETFFQTRPREKHVFENAILYPPKHLADQIQTLRQPIREENNYFLRQLLSRVQLREGLEREQAARYLNSVYTAFWTILEQYSPWNRTSDLHTMLSEAGELLNMFLFGIADSDVSQTCGRFD